LAQTVVWDESVDGDLTTNDYPVSNTDFQSINLVNGVNLIRGLVGNTTCNGTQCSSDSFSFTVPNGSSVTSIIVSALTLQNGNIGTSIGGATGSPLAYNGNIVTLSSIGDNLLPLFGGTPLTPEEYGITLGENTNEGSIYEISITLALTPPSSGGNVPTLSEWGLIILALLLMTLGTLVLVQPNWRGRFGQEH